MAKSTKQKRAAHFKKKSTKPAPGDASATTKPSKKAFFYFQSKFSALKLYQIIFFLAYENKTTAFIINYLKNFYSITKIINELIIQK
mgnify:CR=1 FL=1